VDKNNNSQAATITQKVIPDTTGITTKKATILKMARINDSNHTTFFGALSLIIDLLKSQYNYYKDHNNNFNLFMRIFDNPSPSG
jgi:Zn-dependent M32 family carboxypeptidase